MKEGMKEPTKAIVVTDIEWETDGKESRLPSAILIPEEEVTSEMKSGADERKAAIGDYLLKKYGCVAHSFFVISSPETKIAVDKVIGSILDYMTEASKKFPEVDVCRDVIYANGNDGTDFDWYVNGRTCEFMCYYEEEPYWGYLKVWLDKTGTIEGRVYTHDDIHHGKELSPRRVCEPRLAKRIAMCLMRRYDIVDWDAVIGVLGGKYEYKDKEET